jgi:hypothetical protein
MPRTASTPGQDRLLHCSPERTVYVAADPNGEPFVRKVFVRGSLADAEREVRIGRLLAGHDVVAYRSAGLDEATHRPAVTMQWHDGTDLARLVAAHGALRAAEACAVLAPVARTLAAMHDLRSAEAPAGLCHGDVKPTNLLRTASTTLLLDFEHARPIGAGAAIDGAAGAQFTGGTRGFAPPEAERGATPSAPFDVYGLGASLRWLLRGGGNHDLPQAPAVDLLLRACLDPDPQQRPSAAMVAEALGELAAAAAADPVEAALHEQARGELAAAAARLQSAPAGDHRTRLVQWIERQRRVLTHLPDLARPPATAPTEPAAVQRELHRVTRALRWFPRAEALLQRRQQLLATAGQLLADAAARNGVERRAEEFERALAWLRDLTRLLDDADRQPGGCPRSLGDDPRTIGLLQRDPRAFLHQLAQQTDAARDELAAEAEAITAAEQRLDLAQAERALEQMAARRGGSAPSVARRRDRLHRLAFYLDRIARALPNVDRVQQQWDATALRPLQEFVTGIAAMALRRDTGDGTAGVVGLRSLQVTLVNLVEEFPHLYAQAGPALDALSASLAHTTDQAWELLADAQQKLGSAPVPVRPLQLVLGRLDTWRILEALVDRPERPRGRLQDGIETLRLQLEQARATRDRLAHGAEQALARGHWTTGLFDMERAVAGLQPGDPHEEAEAVRLRERLQRARRMKEEVEQAVRRNVELATLYGSLQDDAGSSFAARVQALAERRDCLHFLAMQLPGERGSLYAADLRQVETQIAIEETADAETQLDRSDDIEARLGIARAALLRLETTAGAAFGSAGGEAPGRLQRLADHWRTVVTRCQGDLDRRTAEVAARRRHRRRLLAMAVGATLVSATAIGFAARAWWGGSTAVAAPKGDDHAPTQGR